MAASDRRRLSENGSFMGWPQASAFFQYPGVCGRSANKTPRKDHPKADNREREEWRMDQSFREKVEHATRAVEQAFQNPNEAADYLDRARHDLRDAYDLARRANDPGRIQQVHDAANAVTQAKNAANQPHQDRSQTNNAIDQAIRACKQIH
jgi:hypothetical protein